VAFLTAQNKESTSPFATWGWTCLFVLVLLSVLPTDRSQATAFKPAQVKAAFIYNLASFVTWPDKTAQAGNEPFVIAVLGDDEIAGNLKILTRDERIRKRPVVIRRCASIAEIGVGRILFVGASMARDWSKIRKVLAGRSILTVGDSDALIRAGSMVNLIQRGRRIHLEINIEAARKAGLHFNSKLLKVARIVRSKP